MQRARARILAAVTAGLTVLTGTVATSGASGAVPSEQVAGLAAAPPRDYIVVLEDGTRAAAVAGRVGAPAQVYDEAFDGYAARLSAGEVRALRRRGDVAAVIPDRRIRVIDPVAASPHGEVAGRFFGPARALSRQRVPRPHLRVGLRDSATAAVDHSGAEELPVDIAIIDSGIAPHPDLNLAGSVDCGGVVGDPIGHGTAVAGIAGAIDNRIGVVGIAPGARLWEIAVTDADGFATMSALLCATEWVAEHSDTIEVANMSLSGPGTDQGSCGVDESGEVVDPYHASLCKGVERGVVYAVAAGNQAADAATALPAGYDDVITVSAYVDYDGLPGGEAVEPPRCTPAGYQPLGEEDDTMAVFSNYGEDVDLAAPGVCVRSTVPCADPAKSNCYGFWDGTSFSSPMVAGAAALYVLGNPDASPEEVRTALVELGEPGPLAQDPDGFAEPLLDVSGL